MRLYEIKNINDNTFEKMKSVHLYESVKYNYLFLKKQAELNPNMLAIDVLGTEINEYRTVIHDLFQQVRKVYLESDDTYQKVAEIWKYINQ
jgi:hypothetical protein